MREGICLMPCLFSQSSANATSIFSLSKAGVFNFCPNLILRMIPRQKIVISLDLFETKIVFPLRGCEWLFYRLKRQYFCSGGQLKLKKTQSLYLTAIFIARSKSSALFLIIL